MLAATVLAGSAVGAAPGVAHANSAPATPVPFAPSNGTVWRQSQSQVFTIRSTDPDNNPYTGEVTVRDSATNAVVTTFTTARVSSGASSSGSPATPLPPGSYTWSAVARDDLGATSAPSATTAVRVNTPPTAAAQVNPPAGRVFSSDEAQVFSATATDPDNDFVRVLITVRDAATGAAVQTFSTSFTASGGTVTAQPPSPLPAGSYTWTAQPVDLPGDSGPATGTRPFTVTLASTECASGTSVIDGYAGGTYVRLRYTHADADTYWICWRVDNGASVRTGGRFVVDEADVTGTPSVDTDSAACSATSGNLLPPSSVIRGTVGDPADPAYVAFGADGYLSTGRAAICLSVADATGPLLHRRVNVPVPQGTAPNARLVQDAAGTYRPAPIDQPAYPSGACQSPAAGTATELVNATVSTGAVWLATWQESGTRAHVCVRTAGGLNRGGRLTVDTGTAGFAPVVGTGSNTSVCDRGVAAITSGPAPFEITRSTATNPGAVCLTVGTTKLAVTLGATGSPVPPSVVWTPDSGVV